MKRRSDAHPPARRPRVSRQRYFVRRVMVGSAAALALFALFRGVGALGGGGSDGALADGGDGDPAAATASTALAASTVDQALATSPAVTAATAPAPTADVAPVPTAAATTSTTGPPAPPSAEHPARVLVVGDSDAGTFGPYLKMLLDDLDIVETTVDYKVSSGLSRPDFFDWPGHLTSTLPTALPDIIVVTFGGNDGQDIRDAAGEIVASGPTGNEEAWSAEYQRRVSTVIEVMAQAGRTVIWVGIPNDDNPEVTARMRVQDQAAKAAVAAQPSVVFVDTWTRFSGRSGGWAEFVIDPRDGVGKDVRADDGFHLNVTGAEILALDIAEVVKSDLRARGAPL